MDPEGICDADPVENSASEESERVDSNAMSVHTEHFIDCDEPDEDGSYSYYYEYDLYTFTFGVPERRRLVARSEEGNELVQFLRQESASVNTTSFDCMPYADRDFAVAVAHLQEEEGKSVVQVLLQGYETLNLSLLMDPNEAAEVPVDAPCGPGGDGGDHDDVPGDVVDMDGVDLKSSPR